MRRTVVLTIGAGILAMVGPATGQQPAWQGPPANTQPNYPPPAQQAYPPAPQQAYPAGPQQNYPPGSLPLVQPVPQPGYPLQPGQPDQAVAPPQVPILQPNPNAPQFNANGQMPQVSLPPVFQPAPLTPQEEAQLNDVLAAWEKSSSRVQNFACTFRRYEYDSTFGPSDRPRVTDTGEIKFAAPDRGMFLVNGQAAPASPAGHSTQWLRPPERWICDGKSIYEFDYRARKVVDHRLPKELQGKAIANGPLPFLFGSTAAQLKQRYYLRVVTPADRVEKEIWLTSYPRYQVDAANFSQADLVLSRRDMQPAALQLFPPGKRGGNDRQSYAFDGVAVNDMLWFMKANPFAANKPDGWQMIVEEAPTVPQPTAQLNPGQLPGAANRR
jgi:TIGR03009 family protein